MKQWLRGASVSHAITCQLLTINSSMGAGTRRREPARSPILEQSALGRHSSEADVYGASGVATTGLHVERRKSVCPNWSNPIGQFAAVAADRSEPMEIRSRPCEARTCKPPQSIFGYTLPITASASSLGRSIRVRRVCVFEFRELCGHCRIAASEPLYREILCLVIGEP